MDKTSVTQILRQWREGDARAVDRLLPLVYDELRRLSRSQLRGERFEHTLQPTALVHEAYLRMVGKDHPQWRDRLHFFAVAAQQMRRILVDHARAKAAEKRGGDWLRVTLDDSLIESDARSRELIALDEALSALAEIDERKAKVVELRSFAGMTLEETAEILGISTATVVNDARFAKAWLHRRICGAEDSPV